MDDLKETIKKIEMDIKPIPEDGTSADPKAKPMEARPLFGEDDIVINALEFELSQVKDLISKQNAAKTRAMTKLDELHDRASVLRKAIGVIQDRHADKGEDSSTGEPDGIEIEDDEPVLTMEIVDDPPEEELEKEQEDE